MTTSTHRPGLAKTFDNEANAFADGLQY